MSNTIQLRDTQGNAKYPVTDASLVIGMPTALSDLTADSTHRTVTDTEKATWNGKYTKPASGIPATDLADDVALLDESSSLLVPLEVERTENKVQSITGNESSTEKYPSIKAMADALGKMGVVSQTQTWKRAADGGYDYIMSNPVMGLIPKANIDLFESAGATFNAVTGYFELGDLTDISYMEMTKIYNSYQATASFAFVGGSGLRFYASGVAKIRSTCPIKNSITIPCNWVFLQMDFEVFLLSGSLTTNNIASCFRSCKYLRRIPESINFTGSNASSVDRAFEGCYSLEDVYIKGLSTSISFPDSQRLKEESIAYIINNAGTATITITLHATAYARATADPAVQAALAAKTNVTLASA